MPRAMKARPTRTLSRVRTAAAAALALGLLAAAPAHADTLTITTAQVKKVLDLRESIAVNGHPDYGPGTEFTGNAWQSYAPGFGAPVTQVAAHTWKRKLCDSGIKVMRAGLKPWPDPNAFGLFQVNDLYRTCGIRFILGTGDPDAAMANIRNLGAYDRGAIAAIEGGNELDNFYWRRCVVAGRPCTVTEWAAQIRASVKDTTAWMDANGYADVPVIAPSFVNRDISWDASVPDARKVGDLSTLVDYGNAHPYSGGLQPEDATRTGLDMAATNAPGKPAWFTEWGVHTGAQGAGPHPGVSEAVQANYLIRGWMTYLGAGVKGAASYELLDDSPDPTGADGEKNFGLVRRDWSNKPVYDAITRMLSYAALNDTTRAFTIPRTKVTIETPAGASVRAVALQNSRGQDVIAVWRPESLWNRDTYQPLSVAPVPFTVTICRPDVRTGLALDAAMPVSGGYWGNRPTATSFTDAAGTKGCRRFTGNAAHGELQLLLERH